MIPTNIVTVTFGTLFGRSRSAVAARSLHQWDYGQVLQFFGIDLPELYSVHFSNLPLGGEAIVEVGNAEGVPIPDALLETGLPIYAWVYLHTGDSDGETAYTVTIPVIKRSEPTDGGHDPADVDSIDRAITALNGAVEAAETAQRGAETAQQAAEEAAEGAKTAVSGAVRFDEEQSLTDEQKARARTNIGIDELPEEGAPAIVVQPNTNSVTDAAPDRPMKVAIEFRPKQTGTGTPSEDNLRPFESWNYVGFEHSNSEIAVDYVITLPFPILGGVVTINEEGPIQVQNWWNHDTYTGQTLPGEWMSDRDVYAPGTLPTIGADIVWKRASPINLTGLEMSLAAFGGYNKVTGDGCEAVIAQYVADTKKYVDKHDQGNVRYDDTQELTDEQQSQARQNIGVDSILMNCNSVKLCDSTQPANNTDAGVTFTWTGNSKCVVTGTPNGNAISRSCVKANPLPTDEVKAGGTYFVYFKSTGTKCRVQASWYIDNPGGFPRAGSQLLTKSQMFTVPAAAISFFLEAYVPSGSGAVNETVTIGLYSAPTNLALWEAIQALS